MNEGAGAMPERADAPRSGSTGRDEVARPSLTTEVRRRRTDQEFFLRLRDAIQQNHKALERLGT
jgi:hypothetical protein